MKHNHFLRKVLALLTALLLCLNGIPVGAMSDGTGSAVGGFNGVVYDPNNVHYKIHYLLDQQNLQTPEQINPNSLQGITIEFISDHLYDNNGHEIPSVVERTGDSTQYFQVSEINNNRPGDLTRYNNTYTRLVVVKPNGESV